MFIYIHPVLFSTVNLTGNEICSLTIVILHFIFFLTILFLFPFHQYLTYLSLSLFIRVIYHELILTTKEYMRESTAIDPKWLVEFAPAFFKFADPTKLSKRKKQEKVEPLHNRLVFLHKCYFIFWLGTKKPMPGVYQSKKYGSSHFINCNYTIIIICH